MTIYSAPDELRKTKSLLFSYLRLPFSEGIIPGAVMEAVAAHVRGGEVLATYDFVDVIDSTQRHGWQVKSTKYDTPVTWKRAKIPNKQELIDASRKSDRGLQALGDAIVTFCNEHIAESLSKYDLDEIGYLRLVVHKDGTVTYFEKLLCTRERPVLFYPSAFTWKWSTPKKSTKKEQLSALHGIHRKTGNKWWAWHGLGENQLHFNGEKYWWPLQNDQSHSIRFRLPNQSEKLSLNDFVSKLDGLMA